MTFYAYLLLTDISHMSLRIHRNQPFPREDFSCDQTFPLNWPQSVEFFANLINDRGVPSEKKRSSSLCRHTTPLRIDFQESVLSRLTPSLAPAAAGQSCARSSQRALGARRPPPVET